MERYEKARDFVYREFQKIHNPVIHMDAFSHTNSVDVFSSLLAISRGINVEQAKICALFHDFAKYADNCKEKDHARLSSLHAHKYLTHSKDFSIADIDEICFAINAHSDKGKVDTPLAEVLKDADVWARFIENPEQDLSPERRKRLLAAAGDLQP